MFLPFLPSSFLTSECARDPLSLFRYPSLMYLQDPSHSRLIWVYNRNKALWLHGLGFVLLSFLAPPFFPF